VAIRCPANGERARPKARSIAAAFAITFTGNQRTDSRAGVSAFRNKSVSAAGASQYSVVDQFCTGQISNGTVSCTLRKIDDDHIGMVTSSGTLKLQRYQWPRGNKTA